MHRTGSVAALGLGVEMHRTGSVAALGLWLEILGSGLEMHRTGSVAALGSGLSNADLGVIGVMLLQQRNAGCRHQMQGCIILEIHDLVYGDNVPEWHLGGQPLL